MLRFRGLQVLLLFAVFWAALNLALTEQAVQVEESTYEGRPVFVLNTEQATWVYDRRGGGFSRLILYRVGPVIP